MTTDRSSSLGSEPGPDAGAPTGIVSREFLVLGAAAMLFFAAFGASNPVLPRFVSEELGGGDTAVGLVVGAFAISSVLLRPFFGGLGDRRGSRLLTVVGCLCGTVGFLLLILVDDPVAAFLARLPVGAGMAAVMTGATTLAINLAPEDRRGEAAGYILVAFHLGLGLGPLLGESVLNAGGFDAVWLVLAGLTTSGAVVALGLRGPVPVEDDDEPLARSPLFHPQGVVPGVVIAVGMMSFMGFSAFVTLYGEQIGLTRVAPVFLVASLTIAAVRVVAGRVPDRLGPVRGGTMALVVLAAGMAVIATWQVPVGLYVGTFVTATGSALLMPAMLPAAVYGVPERRRSAAIATFTVFVDIAAVLSGPLFGFVASRSDYSGVFVAGCVTTLVALVLLHTLLAPRVPKGRLPSVPTVAESVLDST